jgi:hypothetical protein
MSSRLMYSTGNERYRYQHRAITNEYSMISYINLMSIIYCQAMG